MELVIRDFNFPHAILFNYDELKAELVQKVEMYKTLQYTEDTINAAKKDRAELNKLKKALGDERLRLEREYMQPFNEFKARVSELMAIIDEPVKLIDSQIKESETAKKVEKRDRIQAFFDEVNPYKDWLHLQQFGKQEWLNASYSITKVKDEIEQRIYEIGNSLEMLGQLPEFGFEAAELFKKTLDVGQSMEKAKEMAAMAAKKAEAERQKAIEAELKKNEAEADPNFRQKRMEEASRELAKTEGMFRQDVQPTVEPDEVIAVIPREWVGFQAYLSSDEAAMLSDFFHTHNIKFKPI